VRDEYALRDYVLPVAFATAVCVSGFIALIYGAELVNKNPTKSDIVLTMNVTDDNAMKDLRLRSMTVIALAFIGAFVWSARDIVRRLISGDLTPSVYYSAGLRMVYAALLSLMLSFLLRAVSFQYSDQLMPVVAFLTGMLPDQALIYLRSRVPVFSEGRNATAELPLDMIEGMNSFHATRLGEVGIDNAQNLAEANLLDLLLRTPFNPAQLIDWIAQAKLYTYFKADIEKLRRVGIRTIFDFKSACSASEQVASITSEVGISPLALRVVYGQVQDDQGIERLAEFRTSLGTLGKSRPALAGS
jgi:hypothetical protein